MEEPKLDEKHENNEDEGENSRKKPGLSQTILRYSDSKDMLLKALGSFGCFADGASTPLIMLVLSRMMNRNAINSAFTLHDIAEDALTLVYLAIAVGLGAFLGENW